ncbi:hypothetical protein ACJMK2_032101 [Sinanodonta woodiana]|uniref:Uncharacterized protein n=1 Tax=Sinanodonta woodiana TaxID=1069815 RepID=A0ABD3X4N5_SINWO
MMSLRIIYLLPILDMVFCRGVKESKLLEHTMSADIFTYYTISLEGHVRIELESLEGDVDLYVSDETLTPDYVNYKLKSVTSGLHSVEVPAEFKRPVGIGIVGHLIHLPSSYKLTIKCIVKTDVNKKILNLETKVLYTKIAKFNQFEMLIWIFFLQIILQVLCFVQLE